MRSAKNVCNFSDADLSPENRKIRSESRMTQDVSLRAQRRSIRVAPIVRTLSGLQVTAARAQQFYNEEIESKRRKDSRLQATQRMADASRVFAGSIRVHTRRTLSFLRFNCGNSRRQRCDLSSGDQVFAQLCGLNGQGKGISSCPCLRVYGLALGASRPCRVALGLVPCIWPCHHCSGTHSRRNSGTCKLASRRRTCAPTGKEGAASSVKEGLFGGARKIACKVHGGES